MRGYRLVSVARTPGGARPWSTRPRRARRTSSAGCAAAFDEAVADARLPARDVSARRASGKTRLADELTGGRGARRRWSRPAARLRTEGAPSPRSIEVAARAAAIERATRPSRHARSSTRCCRGRATDGRRRASAGRPRSGAGGLHRGDLLGVPPGCSRRGARPRRSCSCSTTSTGQPTTSTSWSTWSKGRDAPLLLVALARPELLGAARGAGKRAARRSTDRARAARRGGRAARSSTSCSAQTALPDGWRSASAARPRATRCFLEELCACARGGRLAGAPKRRL